MQNLVGFLVKTMLKLSLSFMLLSFMFENMDYLRLLMGRCQVIFQRHFSK